MLKILPCSHCSTEQFCQPQQPQGSERHLDGELKLLAPLALSPLTPLALSPLAHIKTSQALKIIKLKGTQPTSSPQ